MPYLIDGHNLIPHIPDLKLSDLDDEASLIKILQRFANQQRSKIEVFFDRAPAGYARKEKHGLVLAHFVHHGITADNAIIARLSKLGSRAKNWTVVSSDREIISEVKSFRSKSIKSADFAASLNREDKDPLTVGDKNPDPDINPDDVDYWLNQFKND